ncbi:hypothetical protein KUDE01_011893, partial [Dissostichus eleginoides]
MNFLGKLTNVLLLVLLAAQALSAAVSLSQMWYHESTRGSSTKCLRVVTLRST